MDKNEFVKLIQETEAERDRDRGQATVDDGSQRHGGPLYNCFFCLKTKPGCELFSMNRTNEDNPHPDVSMLYNQKFVVCPDCSAKGMEHLAKHLDHWITTQKMLKTTRASRIKRKKRKR